jgi:arylsulfatase A-like enzyme
VGKVVETLQKNGLLENSIIMFSTDNGGAAAGFNSNAASNYPLRGVSWILFPIKTQFHIKFILRFADGSV